MSDGTPIPGGDGSHSYAFVVDEEGGDPLGITEWHRRADGVDGDCGGGVYWRTSEKSPQIVPRHELVSLDPLTISPSLACPRCGCHGHIQNGVWTDA